VQTVTIPPNGEEMARRIKLGSGSSLTNHPSSDQPPATHQQVIQEQEEECSDDRNHTKTFITIGLPSATTSGRAAHVRKTTLRTPGLEPAFRRHVKPLGGR
jgi:hypothetical protein